MKKIQKAMIERQDEDIIYIGEVAQRVYNGEGGEFLRAIVNGIQMEEIGRYKHDKTVNSDTKMGRIEGAQMVIDAFETAITQKDLKEQELAESNRYKQGDPDGEARRL